MLRTFLPSVLLCSAALAAGRMEAAERPVIRIDAARSAGEAAPMVYGHNIEAADERGIFARIDLPKPSPDGVNTGKGHWDPVQMRPDPAAVRFLREIKTGMLRYPGGCLAHNFDWRKTVGPVESRPDWKFGLAEYLELCRVVGAEPLITFSDYALPAEELPRLAADLVEYLNAPARPEFPQAMKRARNGHPEPYGVKYFEIGNETYHDNHNLKPHRRFSVEAYVDFARKTIEQVRRVDPSVKIGVVGHTMNLDSRPDFWDETVYRELGPHVDFIIHHYYAPKLDSLSPAEALHSTVTAGELLRLRLANFRRQVRELAGRELPVAVTEYNISGVQNQPVPWRHSYLAGLNMAEILREFRRPENRVLAASYWQAIGGYFGMIQRRGDGGHSRSGAWPFFQLWTRHTGSELLPVEVTGNPRREMVAARVGQVTARGETLVLPRALGEVTRFDLYFQALAAAGCSGSGNARHLQFRLNGCGKQSYPTFLTVHRPAAVPADSGFTLRADFEARFQPAANNTGSAALGFGLMDLRGYEATRLATAVGGLEESGEWKKFSCSLSVGADCPGITGLLRVEKPRGELFGLLELRNLKLSLFGDARIPAVPLLAVEASRLDANRIALAVINRSPDAAVPGRVEVAGMRPRSGIARELYQEDVTRATAWNPVEKRVSPAADGSFDWEFPPHSLTVFELNALK